MSTQQNTNAPSWRQTKFFAIKANSILRPNARTLKFDALPGLFGIEEIEVTDAHLKAGKAEVKSWENPPTDVKAAEERVAWWLAFHDALRELGCGPHPGETKKNRTGMGAALDYAGNVRHIDMDARERAVRFLSRAGFEDPEMFGLPESTTPTVGGNALRRRGAIQDVEQAPTQTSDRPAVNQTVGADDLKAKVELLKAAGLSEEAIGAAVATLMLANG